MKKNNFFILITVVLCFSRSVLALNSTEVQKTISYNVKLYKDGRYDYTIDNIQFSATNAYNIFRDYFWNANQLKKSFRNTGTQLKKLSVSSGINYDLNACQEAKYTVQNVSTKKFLGIFSINASLTFQCTLKPVADDTTACEQKCTLNNEGDAGRMFKMNDSSQLPFQVIVCRKIQENANGIKCTISSKGISKDIKFGFQNSKAYTNSLAGSIVTLRSNVNLAIQSTGDQSDFVVSNNNTFYAKKIDFWEKASEKVILENGIFINSNSQSENFQIGDL